MSKEKQFDYTFTIIGIGGTPIEGFFDALEGLAFDPGAHIKGDVVYAQDGNKSDKPITIIVDDIIKRSDEHE